MPIQIFGTKKHPDVRKALRFFSERRAEVQFVDFQVRAPSPGELRRFAQKFGVESLVDPKSKRYADLGLAVARYSPERWLEKLVEEPMLLRLPLVRNGNRLTVGVEDQEWKAWF